MITRDVIENLLNEHRKKAYITCDETCFCWDVEELLERVERSRVVSIQTEKSDKHWLEDRDFTP